MHEVKLTAHALIGRKRDQASLCCYTECKLIDKDIVNYIIYINKQNVYKPYTYDEGDITYKLRPSVGLIRRINTRKKIINIDYSYYFDD